MDLAIKQADLVSMLEALSFVKENPASGITGLARFSAKNGALLAEVYDSVVKATVRTLDLEIFEDGVAYFPVRRLLTTVSKYPRGLIRIRLLKDKVEAWSIESIPERDTGYAGRPPVTRIVQVVQPSWLPADPENGEWVRLQVGELLSLCVAAKAYTAKGNGPLFLQNLYSIPTDDGAVLFVSDGHRIFRSPLPLPSKKFALHETALSELTAFFSRHKRDSVEVLVGERSVSFRVTNERLDVRQVALSAPALAKTIVDVPTEVKAAVKITDLDAALDRAEVYTQANKALFLHIRKSEIVVKSSTGEGDHVEAVEADANGELLLRVNSSWVSVALGLLLREGATHVLLRSGKDKPVFLEGLTRKSLHVLSQIEE